MDRIKYVDIFRGFAILVMVFFHFIDLFGEVNVYTDFPYFIESVGTFAFTPPPVLFLSVAGMSSYLLVKRRKSQGFETPEIIRNIVVKYGRYVLISLPFTWFVFDLQTFLTWNEALQGIGTTIIFLSILYVIRDLETPGTLALIAGIGTVQWQRASILSFFQQLSLPSMLDPAAGFLYQMVFGGWFSVTNLMPFALAGLLTIKILHEKDSPEKVLGIGAAMTAASLLLNGAGIGGFGFYTRTVLLSLYGSGTSMIIFYVLHQLWNRGGDWSWLSKFGRMAFPVYIWHFLLIVKPAKMVGLENSVSHLGAYPVAFALTAACVIVSVKYFDRTRT